MSPWRIEFNEHSSYDGEDIVVENMRPLTIPSHGNNTNSLIIAAKFNPETGNPMLMVQEESPSCPQLQACKTDFYQPADSPITQTDYLSFWDISGIIYISS